MTDWRDKPDLELTADDLGEMLEQGEAVELVGGPPQRLPGGGQIMAPSPSAGVRTVVRDWNRTWGQRTVPGNLTASR